MISIYLVKKIYKRTLDKEDFNPEWKKCTYCKKSLIGTRKQSWCGDKNCLHEYWIRTDSSYARRQVRKRDKGICSLCGLDCVKLRKQFKEMPHKERLIEAKKYNLTKKELYKSLWAADHKTPVILGGGGCGLDNLRTLCIKCHKKETKLLREQLKLNKMKK